VEHTSGEAAGEAEGRVDGDESQHEAQVDDIVRGVEDKLGVAHGDE